MEAWGSEAGMAFRRLAKAVCLCRTVRISGRPIETISIN